MKRLGYTAIAIVLLGVLALMHYCLPQTDVVRVVNTDIRRMDFGANAIFYAASESSGAPNASTDVRFIETVTADGDPMVYRNEDTGWGWPPYFKFDSADLQASAADLVSTREAPIWVAVHHYGWRSRLLSAFPNATSIRRVEGPEVTFFPWFAIGVMVFLLVAAVAIWRVAQLFLRNTVLPLFGRGRKGRGSDEEI